MSTPSNKTFLLPSGEEATLMEPIILSASRSTDIPAFYSKWFINRLEAGYCVWTNPFNQKKTKVSFEKCKVIVFWTKNPKPILPYLKELDEKGIHYYFQFTLNDYVSEGFEPNVPSLEERIETFKTLSGMIGRERVIWRFDPLIVPPGQTVRDLLKKVWTIGNRLQGFTDKLVFSFIDIVGYKKVQNNFIKETTLFNRDNIEKAESDTRQKIEIVEGLVKLREAWREKGWKLTLATCAEDIDLEKFQIEHNRCIDGELMKRVFADDKVFVHYLNYGKMPEKNLFGDALPDPKAKSKTAGQLKDKGQRKICGCMVSKDIGMYNTCRHFCVYCYANTSRDIVSKNEAKHDDDGESII